MGRFDRDSRRNGSRRARARDAPARADLAARACRFSRSARAVVDDKLSFSATLMRAGEVDAAHRLLAEVEAEITDHKAALLAHVAQSESRARPSRRMQVARLASAAVLAAAAATSSTLPAPIPGAGDPAAATRPAVTDPGGDEAPAASGPGRGHRRGVRIVRVGGVEVALGRRSMAVLRRWRRHGAGDLSDLLALLPARARAAIARARAGADAAAAEVVTAVEAAAATAFRVDREDPKPPPGDGHDGGAGEPGSAGTPAPELPIPEP